MSDGLYLCRVCGDRETTSDVCWSCRRQEMIDNDDFGYSSPRCPKCGEYWVEAQDDTLSVYKCEMCNHDFTINQGDR